MSYTPIGTVAVLRGYDTDDELVGEHVLGDSLTLNLGADLVCRAGGLTWFLEHDRV